MISSETAPGMNILGIDIGGTKTHLRLRTSERTEDLVRPSKDWRRRDWAQDAQALLALIREFAGTATLSAIGIGAHGCDDDDECKAFETEFRRRSSVPISVVNDAELMPLALGLRYQIGVVAGTGSIAVCRTAEGKMQVAGGWGWAIGDEGSAAAIVRDAARAVALHLDRGGGLDEPLCTALMSSLAVPSPSRMGSVLAGLGSAAAIGAHAPAVFAAVDQGSSLAEQVINENGAALAGLVTRLRSRGVDADHAVAGGGVISSQPRLWQAFTEGLKAQGQAKLTAHLFQGPPVEGACQLALDIAQAGLPSRQTSFSSHS
ncbi:sugar kinase [Limoniibacter endophyticus]|uniref:Sugar kinase n=2 Tax=Limoniibacter endophyticus TaxID=1565040 RepID=A0A8J3GIK9_9HYPH|nr:sugar kinase [Limoniibacter endophyticus]